MSPATHNETNETTIFNEFLSSRPVCRAFSAERFHNSGQLQPINVFARPDVDGSHVVQTCAGLTATELLQTRRQRLRRLVAVRIRHHGQRVEYCCSGT